MIEIFEGLPGSGKSYCLVKDRLILWLKAGRKVWVYMEGVDLFKVEYLLGIDGVKDLLVPVSRSEISSLPVLVGVNGAVILDEIQMVFRAGEKPDRSWLEWLERHRHFGVDIVFACQRWDQLPAALTRLVEVTTRFQKLGVLGMSRGYLARVRGGPTEKTTIRSYKGSYSSKVYSLYSSYVSSVAAEQSVRPSVLGSLPVLAVFVSLLVVGWLWWGRSTWTVLGGASDVVASSSVVGDDVVLGSERVAGSPVPAVPLALESSSGPASGRPDPAIGPLVIIGHFCPTRDGAECLWATADGRALTPEEIVLETGKPIRVRPDKHDLFVIEGEGVRYAFMGSGAF